MAGGLAADAVRLTDGDAAESRLGGRNSLGSSPAFGEVTVNEVECHSIN